MIERRDCNFEASVTRCHGDVWEWATRRGVPAGAPPAPESLGDPRRTRQGATEDWTNRARQRILEAYPFQSEIRMATMSHNPVLRRGGFDETRAEADGATMTLGGTVLKTFLLLGIAAAGMV